MTERLTRMFVRLFISAAILGVFIVLISGKSDARDDRKIPKFKNVEMGIFRGGRPDESDLRFLDSKGFEVVVNLENRSKIVEAEKEIVGKLGMDFMNKPMSVWEAPEDAMVDDLLTFMKRNQSRSMFVHCKHGEDRTGLIIGLYRVEVQGWAPSKAYREMLDMGFHPEFFPIDQYFKKRTKYKPLAEDLFGLTQNDY